jgi:integrase
MTVAGEKVKRSRGTGSLFKRGDTIYLRYYRNGKRIVESAHTNNEEKAERKLQRALRLIETGEYLAPRQRRVKVRELWDTLIRHYSLQKKATLDILESKWKLRLEPFFGDRQAAQVTTDLLSDYMLKCQEDGLENATINRDLAALHKAFTLGFKCTPKKVQSIPIFPDRLVESSPRQGFVEQKDFDRLCQSTKEPWMKALLVTAYAFGFRRGELLGMRLNQVDLMNRTIRLWRGTTKSKEPRLIVMTEDVYQWILQMCMGKRRDDYVFTRNGQPIVDIRDEWTKISKAVELPDLIFHDLRRSAVRNMIRAGISEKQAMMISGHATRSIFDRYDITSERDLAAAAQKIQDNVKAERAKAETFKNGVQVGAQAVAHAA